MPQDPTEDLAVLRDDIDRMGQQFDKAAQAARRPVTEYDRTGTVTVQVDADGELQKVSIAGGWTRHYGPEELGGAVREALQTAAAVRAQAWGESYGNSREPMRAGPGPSIDTGSIVATLDDAQANGVDLHAVLSQLRILAQEVDQAVDAVTEQADAQVAAQFRERSSSGNVTATVSGAGDLVDLEFARPWVETAHPTNLGREATEAVAAAQQSQRLQSVQLLSSAGPLAEVERLNGDPQAMLRRLGIR